MIREVARLKAATPMDSAEFGSRVALSADGSTIAVSSDLEPSETGASGAGAVYLFVRTAGAWTLQARVTAPDGVAGDFFGSSIALSADGSTLAVGAEGESSTATGIDPKDNDEGAPNSGAVYVFRRDSSWTESVFIKASNADPDDVFGVSLALSADGTRLVVGAIGEASSSKGPNGDQVDNSARRAGAVYVFDVRDDSWVQTTYLKASNSRSGDLFGWSVGLSASGTSLIVGAVFESNGSVGVDGPEDSGTAALSGAAYVFTESNGSWSQDAYVKASNAGIADSFGFYVGLSGDGQTAVVGATGEASASDGVDGDQDDDGAASSGAVYVFVRDEARWAQESYLKASNSDAGDAFGASASISSDGNALIVGAPAEAGPARGIARAQGNGSPRSGAVYRFTRVLHAWSQAAYIKSTNSAPENRFGDSVGVIVDGTSFVVGAPGESSSSDDRDDNALPRSGAAYVFETSP